MTAPFRSAYGAPARTDHSQMVIDQFIGILPRLVNANEIKDTLSFRAEQLEKILADKTISEKTQWMALGELSGLRAIKADIDACLGRR